MAGFSADGSHFMYLESSRDTGAGIPKSTLQVVNIAANHCVQDGCKQTQYGEADAGLEMAVAENSLLQLTWNLRQALQLTPPAPGTKLAIVSRSHTLDGTETVTARLNNSNQVLKLRLRQQQLGSMDQGNIRTAMQLEVNDNGQWRSLDSLNHYREWVLGYSIRELRLSPDGQTVVVLVTATKPTFEGTLGTTLIQGFELQPQ
jgi:predicted secreted protein